MSGLKEEVGRQEAEISNLSGRMKKLTDEDNPCQMNQHSTHFVVICV